MARFFRWEMAIGQSSKHGGFICPRKCRTGYAYSLTLHDRNNTRVLGYDNAHAVKPLRKRFGAVKTTWDHAHRMNKVEPYEFESAAQLLEDFWNEVDRFMNEGKR